MKVKTSELKGVQLDWVVGTIERNEVIAQSGCDMHNTYGSEWKPSTYWHQGGPIIEREKINLVFDKSLWSADINEDVFGIGDTLNRSNALLRCQQTWR